MEPFSDFETRQEGALERRGQRGLPCGSSWLKEWFVISPEYLVAFSSRTSSHVSLCICLAAITSVEEEDKGVFRILYASTLGKSPCDAKKHAVCLRAGAEDEKKSWITSISEAQEIRRRDRFFVPLSSASERLAMHRRRAEAAELAAAAAGEDRRRSRLSAATLSLASALTAPQRAASGAGFRALARAAAAKREASLRLRFVLASCARRCAAKALDAWRAPDRQLAREVGLCRALCVAATTRARREVLLRAVGKLSALLSPKVRTDATQTVSEEVQTGSAVCVTAEVQTQQRLATLVDAAVQTESLGPLESPGALPGGSAQSVSALEAVAKAENRRPSGYAEALLEELGLPSESGSESGSCSEVGEAAPSLARVRLDSDADPTDAEAGGVDAAPQPTKPSERSIVQNLEGCLEDAATSVSEVRSALGKLGDQVQEVASRVASRAESLISEVHESIRQEEGQYERRWWQNFAEVVTGKDEVHPGERCADTGSSYDLRRTAEPLCRDVRTDPSGSEEADSSMEELDFEALSTPDSVDLRPAFFHPGGDTGGAGSPQVPALPSPLRLPAFKMRGPPPRPHCLPPATPSQRLRAGSEPSDSDSAVQSSDVWPVQGPSFRFQPLPPGPLAFARRREGR